jgi:hypothetical protein
MAQDHRLKRVKPLEWGNCSDGDGGEMHTFDSSMDHALLSFRFLICILVNQMHVTEALRRGKREPVMLVISPCWILYAARVRWRRWIVYLAHLLA